MLAHTYRARYKRVLVGTNILSNIKNPADLQGSVHGHQGKEATTRQ